MPQQPSPDAPAPDQPDRPTNAQWCREFAPTFPVQLESIIAEFFPTKTMQETDAVADRLITAFRNATQS